MNNHREERSSNELLLQAQTLLMNHVFNHVDSMSLKCAVELGIPDAVHRYGRPITTTELLSALSIPTTKEPYFRRLMRMLTHSGFFVRVEEDDAYSLTPLSRLLVHQDEQHLGGLSPFVAAMLHPFLMNPFHSMSSWLRGAGGDDEQSTPFTIALGCGAWEKFESDPEFRRVFNEGMASDARFVMDVLLRDCSHVFDGLTSLVDVGGGTGSAARAIAEALPQVKCSVLELPHVVDAISPEENGLVEFVSGDMFDSVPPANAVLLKWILHDWSDQECVKILRRCKEAIPSKEEGGKVIIIDVVVGSGDGCGTGKTRETQLYWDMLMMALCPGAEREEEEWGKIFLEAGFCGGYKITPALGVRSVIQLYP